MQSPQKGAKQASKWGSFFQQAVAGVESRLDTILAEGDEQPNQSSQPPKPTPHTSQPLPKDGMSAVPASIKPTALKQSPRSSADRPRDSSTPALSRDTSVKNARQKADDGEVKAVAGANGDTFRNNVTDKTNGVTAGTESEHDFTLTNGQKTQQGPENGISNASELDEPTSDGNQNSTSSDSDLKKQLEQLQSDFETSELRRQEEIHSHMERIDALQAKLQYLSRQASEKAGQEASSLPAGSLEKKLAEKEEQIALLMEEGQTLSKIELKHSTTIKQLRSKAVEERKALNEAKGMIEKTERESQALREKVKRSQTIEKQASEQQRAVTNLTKEVQSLRNDLAEKKSLLSKLEAQNTSSQAKISEAERKEQAEALEKERSLVSDLRDDLSNSKIEKELAEERLRAEIKQVKEAKSRDQERSKAMEVELRGEQAMLESKLEAFRARAEEVSSGVTGDAQAKLLRQVETLQAQYAVANENWQGIESSMSTRLTSLEKERDDLAKRESDSRRKARESSSKHKRVSEELETLQESHRILEQDFTDHKEALEKTQKRAEKAEDALAQVRSELASERQSFESKLHQRLDEEKSKFRDDGLQTPTSFHNGRPRSPAPFGRRPQVIDTNMSSRRHSGRSPSIEPAGSLWGERPSSRRASTQPFPRSPEIGTPRRVDSTPSIHDKNRFGSVTNETPSIAVPEEDYFEGVMSPNSPHRTVEDMISNSTAGAGPSVQLVERMSAAVRRLESEKAASKEELSRLSAQRDTAREEVVKLMTELETKQSLDAKVSTLQSDLDQLNARYQTTLEMLGEKSERVEELQADVVDMKKIYRELLDSTMK